MSSRVALVTGGTGGIGTAICRKLADMGHRVATNYRNQEKALAWQAQMKADGYEVTLVKGDVTSPGEAEAMVREIEAKLGPVEILVNNAGTIQVGPMDTMTEADFEGAFALHFWAPYRMTQAALPDMRRNGFGRIVNISSIGGKVSVPHLLPYSASKFALVGYSEGLRSELLPEGIFVTTVCPGLMRTGSPRNAEFKGQHEKEYAWFALSDSLPGLSQSADAAAERVLDALVHGDAEVVTSLPAQILALVHGVFPGAVADGLSLAQRFLPDPGGIGTGRRAGHQSETPLTRSPLTALTRRAEVDNNQRAGANGHS